MIGNDIVDIKASEFSSMQRFMRYAAKVCTDHELLQLGRFEGRQQTLWRFWSIKEAAYKAGLRLAVCNSFSPYKIKVELLDEFSAEVHIDTTKFIARSILNCDYVYSEVVLVDSDLSLKRNIVDLKSSSEIKKILILTKLSMVYRE